MQNTEGAGPAPLRLFSKFTNIKRIVVVVTAIAVKVKVKIIFMVKVFGKPHLDLSSVLGVSPSETLREQSYDFFNEIIRV